MAKAKKSVLQAMSDPVTEMELPMDAPSNWKWARLIQIYYFIDYRGKTPTKIEKGIPLVTAKNVRKGYLDYSIAEYISEEEYIERQTRGISHCGDILFTTEAPMGNVAIADLDVFSAGQRVITFQKRTHTNWANNKFYYYYILSDWFQGELDRQKTGSTVAGIKAEKLMRFPIPLPPIDEQQRIVDRIESLFAKLDEAKEKAQAVVDGFEDRKAAILHKALSGELTEEWRKGNGAPKFKQVKLGACLKTMETKKPVGEYFSYIDIDSIDNKRQIVRSPKKTLVKEAPSRASRAVHSGDVLFSMVRPYLKNIALIDESLQDCIASTGFYVCSPKSDLDSQFLYYLLCSKDSIDYLMQFMKGDNSPSIRKDDLLGMDIWLPSLPEQKQIESILDTTLDKEQQAKEVAEQVMDQIDTMKKSILARAFRGELGTNDPADESAEELLKQIL